MKFHVGQRVRIVCAGSILNGSLATVTEIHTNRRVGFPEGPVNRVPLAYAVEVDGAGTLHPLSGFPIGYEPHELEPIPDATELGTWEQVQAICKWTPSTVKA